MANSKNVVRLKSTESGHCYYTTREKRNTPEKLELLKFDPTPGVRRKVIYKEAKLK